MQKCVLQHHTSTQIYAKVIEQKVSDDMKLLREKIMVNNPHRTRKEAICFFCKNFVLMMQI